MYSVLLNRRRDVTYYDIISWSLELCSSCVRRDQRVQRVSEQVVNDSLVPQCDDDDDDVLPVLC